MTSRFTRNGWLVLPVSLTLRIPLALLAYAFGFLADLFRALESRTDRTMNAMPKPEINPVWRQEEQARIHKEINRKFRNG